MRLTSARPCARPGASQTRSDRWCELARAGDLTPRLPDGSQPVVAMAPVNGHAAAHRRATPTYEEVRARAVVVAVEQPEDETWQVDAPMATMMSQGARQCDDQVRVEQVRVEQVGRPGPQICVGPVAEQGEARCHHLTRHRQLLGVRPERLPLLLRQHRRHLSLGR